MYSQFHIDAHPTVVIIDRNAGMFHSSRGNHDESRVLDRSLFAPTDAIMRR